MSVDVAAIVSQSWPFVGAAAGAYGTAVVTRATDEGANATVAFGQRVLQRLWHREEGRPYLRRQLQGVEDDPQNEGARAALREEIRRQLQEDDELRRDVAAMLADAPPPGGDSVTASGDRSVAVGENTGIIVTGDSADIRWR